MFIGGKPLFGYVNFGLSLDGIEKCISANGLREDYRYMFCEQDWSGYNFKLGLIRPNEKNPHMFYQYRGKTLPGGIEFIPNPSGIYKELFSWSALEYIYDMKIPAMQSADKIFYACRKLKTVEVFRVAKYTTFASTFYDCINLENIRFEGVIGQNKLSLSSCTKLSKESLLSLIDCLEDKSEDTSGTVWKVSIGSANLAKLEDTEKAIAIEKGWTLV